MQVNLIEQNLAAQDNILAALTDVYAQTANIRKNVEEILKRREITISSLINSYDAYEDLLAKSSKGLEFYRKLEINVTKLLQRVKSTCKVQEEEREQILAQDSKSTYEKTDATIPSTYDQGRRSNNGLKLKDYLNSRVESGTGYQNPYYNLYKGHAVALQMDSSSKSLVTDTGNKNIIQSPNTISVSEIPSSSTRSQHYYPTTYTDYRISSSSYPYNVQTYYENPIALNQSSLPTNTNATGIYQQPGLSASTATSVSNSSIQYPANSYLSNGQPLPASIVTQEKFRDVAHNYNVSNTTLQYDTYQSPTGYNIATPYVSNHEKATIKSGTTKVSSQVQPVSTRVSVSTISTTVNSTMSIDDQRQVSYGIAPQSQQYNSQQKTLNQDIPHSGQNIAVRPQQTLSTKDNTLTQNYSLPQSGHTEMTYLQNYHQNTTYYNPTELQTQRIPYTHGTYDTTVIPPTQYVQSQLPSTSNQSIHSVTSTSENSASYPSNLHSINSVQYSQQTSTEQSNQNYADKTYAAYSTQVQMNAPTNYPSTYQTYQHGTAGAPYQQQNMISGDTSNAYAYLNSSSNSEIIQSHAKSTPVTQSYSQSYQYSQQVPYSGYVQYPNYSQSQNYNYMQNAHGTNTIAYTYNPSTNQAQGYAYVSNVQSVQTSQASQEATVSTSDITASNVHYQQQETNSKYTNASNNAAVSQTQSSQYSQVYQSQTGTDTYYTTPYGLQMQGQSMLYIFH